jgi:hypothetical protein
MRETYTVKDAENSSDDTTQVKVARLRVVLGLAKLMKAIAIPNYELKCQVCNQLPTIDLKPRLEGLTVIHLRLCGVCVWGQAKMADPEEWNR